MALHKDFMILLDGDLAGRRSQVAYISEFGEYIRSKIKVYGDLVPEMGANMMENIFTEDEKIAISRMFNSELNSCNKSAFNTAIQSALLKNERIDFYRMRRCAHSNNCCVLWIGLFIDLLLWPLKGCFVAFRVRFCTHFASERSTF